MIDRRGPILATVQTLAAGIAGGWVFSILGLPVPWLAGPMAAVAALAMSGQSVRLPRLLCDTGLFVAGISLGSTVSPEALAAVSRYPASIVALVLSVAAIMVVSMVLLELAFGWDRQTAYLASVPGALTMTMALVAETRADAGRVAVVQAIRLFALVALLPILITGSAASAPTSGQTVMTPAGMACLCLVALALDALLTRIGAITPLFLGGMISATVLHVSDLVPGALPEPIVIVGFLLIGVYAGLRFDGMTVAVMVRVLVPGLVSLAATLAVTVAVAWLVVGLAGVAPAEALVALAPGGVEAMILIGASLGLDTLYIGTHHVVRLLVLNALTPVFVPRQPRSETEHRPHSANPPSAR